MSEPGDLKDGVFVILASQSSILLVKHNYGEGLWSLPGGGVKQGEIVSHAARREVIEETGISHINRLRQVGQFTLIKRYGLVVLFEALGWFGDPKADKKEIADCRFFNLDGISALKKSEEIYRAQYKLIDMFVSYRYKDRPIYGKLTDPPIVELEE